MKLFQELGIILFSYFLPISRPVDDDCQVAESAAKGFAFDNSTG